MEKQEKKVKSDVKLSVFRSILYTLKTVWRGDKGCVIYSFFKNCTEEVFNAFFVVYLTQKIYSFIEEGVEYKELFRIVIFFCSIQIFIHLSSAGYAFYIRYKKPKVYRSIFSGIIDKANTIELTRYEQPDFYDKFSRTLDECLSKAMDALQNLTLSIGVFLSACTSIAIIISIDFKMLFILIPPVVGALFFGALQNKQHLKLREEETHDKRQMEYVKRVFYEKKYAGEIRLYGIRDILFKKHKDGYEGRYQTHVKHRKKIAFYQFMHSIVCFGLTLLCSYLYISYVVKIQGVMKIGAYVAIVTVINFVAWKILQSLKTGVEAGTCCLYMNSLKQFLEYVPQKEYLGTLKLQKTLGNIEFEHVTFQYAGADSPVIKDLCLSIHKGEKITLVGENGAGKTTLIKLMMGLYPVTEGKVIAEGHDIHDYDIEDYYDHFGTVFQDLQIFALPLAENVLLRSPENDSERELVKTSLIKAQFGDTLEKMEKGIDTMITKEFDNHGFVCSGGQAQKIAIARVFAKNPDVVILDEPSSALDPIAEYNMYDNMLQVSEGKTVVFISHRLSSARIADKIYFLEHGTIIESGSHDELIELDGKYAKMFKLQAQNYREEEHHE